MSKSEQHGFLIDKKVNAWICVAFLVVIVALYFIYLFAMSQNALMGDKPDVVQTGIYNYTSTHIESYIPINQSHHNVTRHNISRLFNGRLGNIMFQYASLLGIADTNRLQPLMIQKEFQLNKCFKMKSSLLPFSIQKDKSGYQKHIFTSSFMYDNRTENLAAVYGEVKNIELVGYYSSFKYFNQIEGEIRQEFEFLPPIQDKVQSYLRLRTANFSSNPTYVGIHIRRTDAVTARAHGYCAAPKEYFTHAMDYMTQKYNNVHFVVTSDDIKWAKRNLGHTNITYSPGFSAAVDLALLANCNHTIISSGTFGWWAAWLANGTTIYYELFPLPGSRLHHAFRKKDYYPHHWLPMQ